MDFSITTGSISKRPFNLIENVVFENREVEGGCGLLNVLCSRHRAHLPIITGRTWFEYLHRSLCVEGEGRGIAADLFMVSTK